jgi:hypothetical protein
VSDGIDESLNIDQLHWLEADIEMGFVGEGGGIGHGGTPVLGSCLVNASGGGKNTQIERLFIGGEVPSFNLLFTPLLTV